MGDLEGRDKDDNPIGNFSAYDFALNIAYAVIANENCYVGISGKLIRQKIENSIANAVGIDLGILYLDPSREGLKFAAVIQNIASKLKFIQKRESLTSACKLGMSYKMNKLTLASDITYPEDNAARINLGAEYLLTTNLALRLGYNSKNKLDSGWTFGAGFKLNTLQIDYAFVPYGELDNTHRVSLTKRF
jgi:long-subunit fatty acid transport protein